MRFDGIDRHFLVIDFAEGAQAFFEKRDQLVGPIFDLSVKGTF